MKRIRLTESELIKLIKNVINENEMNNSGEKRESKGKATPKPRCIPENVIPLDEIVGQADEYSKYAPGVSKRRMGVNSMVDTLGILNNLII